MGSGISREDYIKDLQNAIDAVGMELTDNTDVRHIPVYLREQVKEYGDYANVFKKFSSWLEYRDRLDTNSINKVLQRYDPDYDMHFENVVTTCDDEKNNRKTPTSSEILYEIIFTRINQGEEFMHLMINDTIKKVYNSTLIWRTQELQHHEIFKSNPELIDTTQEIYERYIVRALTEYETHLEAMMKACPESQCSKLYDYPNLKWTSISRAVSCAVCHLIHEDALYMVKHKNANPLITICLHKLLPEHACDTEIDPQDFQQESFGGIVGPEIYLIMLVLVISMVLC
jgi:hypothetical protein